MTTPPDPPNIVVCAAGTRTVEMPRMEPADSAAPWPHVSEPRIIFDRIELTIGGAGIFAGYHEPSHTWFVADDAGRRTQIQAMIEQGRDAQH